MQHYIKRAFILGMGALLLALAFALSPFFVGITTAASKSATWTGQTTDWTNVRTGPGTTYAIATTYAPGTTVIVYATVKGQTVLNGISDWYRISDLHSVAKYVYSTLVTRVSNGGGAGPAPSAKGKVIVVSLSHQWLYAYQDGKEVFNAAVMTGRPALPTPTGTYHVFAKLSPTTFYSPWPPGSPYYYPPTHINHALEWRAGGYFLHDSWWHSVYGPGTNGWHYDPKFGWQWGTHGCVAMPDSAASWLYNWAPIGTIVQINP